MPDDLPKLLRTFRGAKLQRVGRRSWWVGQFSQAQAAQRTGIPLRNWQNWESGHRTPSDLALAEIKRRLGVR